MSEEFAKLFVQSPQLKGALEQESNTVAGETLAQRRLRFAEAAAIFEEVATRGRNLAVFCNLRIGRQDARLAYSNFLLLPCPSASNFLCFGE